MKEYSLTNGWTLLLHESCSAFTDHSNRSVVLDWDLDAVLVITTTEGGIEVSNSTYGLKHKVDIINKTFILLHELGEDDDDE